MNTKDETRKLPVKKLREIILLILFSYDFNQSEPEELSMFVMNELKVSKKHVKEAVAMAQKIYQHIEQLDAAISAVSALYDFHRIQRVERAILRLAGYELLIEKQLEPAIVIAEAQRLAKKFSAPEAISFCQGLLDAMVKNR